MPHRATRNADLLGFGASDPASVAQVFREIAAGAVDDGIEFDPTSVTGEEIRKETGYGGMRVIISGELAIPAATRSFDFSTDGQLQGISSTSGIGNTFAWIGSLPTGESWQGPVAGSVMLEYDDSNGHSNFWVVKRSVDTPVSAPVDITYDYDNDGLLTGVYAPGADMSLVRDPGNGLLDSTWLGQVADDRSYNAFAEPIGYSAAVGGSGLYSAAYTRDKLGRIIHKVETIQGTTRTFDYGYDAAGRLESVKLGGVTVASWSWDANGNRLTASTPGGTTSCSYDSQDRLNACGEVSYTRNLSGQLTERSDASAGTSTQYDYDLFGSPRLVINVATGAIAQRIDYDAWGNVTLDNHRVVAA